MAAGEPDGRREPHRREECAGGSLSRRCTPASARTGGLAENADLWHRGISPGQTTTPAGGESGGRLHGRLGGEESDRVSTVANDP